MRKSLIAIVVFVSALASPPRAAEPDWHITATVAESCSCAVSCSCNFGGEPNRNPCEGNRLIAIKSGHYENVDLAGKSVKILNLPNPAYQDYTQFRSIAHKHASDKATWSHSGTNGFTSTMEVGSRR
jgi:hypothetical protein